MGCWYSRVEREESVSRCKSRRKYMKQLVQSRHAMSAAHSMYLRSLRSTGSALLRFSSAETKLHHHPPPPRPTTNHHHLHQRHHHHPPPPPPPMSPSTDTWTTSVTASPALPPPPPPPPPSSSAWDFWYPFSAGASAGVGAGTEEEDEWESATTVTTTTAAAATEGVARGVRVVHAPPPPPSSSVEESSSSELAMVVSRSNGKELVEIIKELDEYLVKAADAGAHLSLLLEVPTSTFSSSSSSHFGTKGGKVYNYGNGWGLGTSSWSWGSSLSPKRSNNNSSFSSNGFGKIGKSDLVSCVVANGSHCSTVERLYVWEKKLFEEVKGAETIKIEHEKKVAKLKKLEMKRADYMKTEKTKKEVEKLESEIMVSSQAIETTSAEITKLRETELYPQLLELVKGLMCMWRSMYESHQVQKHIVQQLKYFNAVPSVEPTSEIHRQSTLQLELEVSQWHASFCNMVRAQHEYIRSLSGWLRLCLFHFSRAPPPSPHGGEPSRIYSLCEEWHLALDRVPDKVASDGINSFLTVIRAIVVQQAEERKQRRRAETVLREFERRAGELRALEAKHGPYSVAGPGRRKRSPVPEKRARVEALRARAEEEKTRHEKSVGVTRAMTLNNLQMGLPHLFEGMVGFSSVCMHAFEAVFNHSKGSDQGLDVKMLMG